MFVNCMKEHYELSKNVATALPLPPCKQMSSLRCDFLGMRREIDKDDRNWKLSIMK
jgi:hypothetical protein